MKDLILINQSEILLSRKISPWLAHRIERLKLEANVQCRFSETAKFDRTRKIGRSSEPHAENNHFSYSTENF